MPLYDFKCAKCGRVEEFFARAEEKEQACSCGWKMERQLSAPMFRPPMQPYRSPITGQWIEGEQSRRNDLARSGSVPYDPEMRKDIDRKKQEDERKLDKAVDTMVESTWHQVNK